MARSVDLSIILPVLNESTGVRRSLAPLQPWRHRGVEIILVDGGSDDDTVEQAAGQVDRVIQAPRGRASQMNAGAAIARGNWLWFLHADTLAGDRHIVALRALAPRGWGRFDVRLEGRRPLFRLIGWLISLRSRFTGIATGDQGLFVERSLFEVVGGFPEQPLMEDIALSARLKRKAGRPVCLRQRLRTSSRRWRRHGAWRTIWLMWSLRWRYWRGADPVELHRLYYGASGDE